MYIIFLFLMACNSGSKYSDKECIGFCYKTCNSFYDYSSRDSEQDENNCEFYCNPAPTVEKETKECYEYIQINLLNIMPNNPFLECACTSEKIQEMYPRDCETIISYYGGYEYFAAQCFDE